MENGKKSFGEKHCRGCGQKIFNATNWVLDKCFLLYPKPLHANKVGRLNKNLVYHYLSLHQFSQRYLWYIVLGLWTIYLWVPLPYQVCQHIDHFSYDVSTKRMCFFLSLLLRRLLLSAQYPLHQGFPNCGTTGNSRTFQVVNDSGKKPV